MQVVSAKSKLICIMTTILEKWKIIWKNFHVHVISAMLKLASNGLEDSNWFKHGVQACLQCF